MRKVGVLGIALIGIWLLTRAIGYLSWPISLATMSGEGSPGLGAVVVSAIPVLLAFVGGLFLLLRRERLSESLFPEGEAPAGGTPDSLLRVGVILIGLLLVVEAIPALISALGSPIVEFAQASALADGLEVSGMSQLWGRAAVGTVAAAASLGLGWFLVARSEYVTRRLLGEVPSPADSGSASISQCPSCGAPYDPSDYAGGLAEPRCSECKGLLPLA